MRGSDVSQPCTASRRLRYSSSIVTQLSCGPVSAAIAAFCVIELMFDVEWPWTTLHCAITSFGAIAQPQRQPVIAYAFDVALQITVLSRMRSNSTLIRL